jgi:hypothetical protein
MSYLIKIDKQFKKHKTIFNEINNIKQNNNIIIKFPWTFNKQDYSTINNNIITYSKDKVYSKNELINYTNFISMINKSLLSIMTYIQIDKILIISSNINFADICLGILKNIKIIMFVYNNKEINSFLLLKEKYKDNIDIYYIGSYLNYNTYNTIKNILSKTDIKLFDTIIVDSTTFNLNNHQENCISISTLLTKTFLEKNGCFILFANLPYENNFYTYSLNLLYEQFLFHNLNEASQYFYTYSKPNIFVFSKLVNKLSNIDEELLNKNLINKFNEKDTNNNYKYNEMFLQNILLRWKTLNYNYNEMLLNIKQTINSKVKRLSYHKNININIDYYNKIVPETTNDLTNQAQYIGDARDFQSRCHWGQKKLLLSEIQFLTKVCQKLNTKSLKDYAVVYAGAAHGFHFPILYNLFPELIWLLYDPARFSKEAHMHPQKEKVKIFNQFFTDETIKHAKQNAENRKILFISDIRLTPDEEAVMKDMTSQAKWGTDLDADYMLLKYKPPYDEEDTKQYKTNTIDDLQINPKYIKNPDLKADDKTFLYLKGDVYIQLFAHIHSVELRLMVEKANGKYELDAINYGEIEKKMFYFNTNLRTSWSTEDYDFLHYIPGYDSSIECVMEYNIIKNYYEYIHNIKDNNIIIQKMYDMAFFHEKLAHTTFINCNYDTMVRTIKKFEKENDDNKLKRLKLWKEISKLNIELSAKTQKEIIMKSGKEILGQDRVNRAIKYLEEYITNRTFIKIE